jgi:hypothetical protein
LWAYRKLIYYIWISTLKKRVDIQKVYDVCGV